MIYNLFLKYRLQIIPNIEMILFTNAIYSVILKTNL